MPSQRYPQPSPSPLDVVTVASTARRWTKVLADIYVGATRIAPTSPGSLSPFLSAVSAAANDLSFLVVLLFCLCGLVATLMLLRVLPVDAAASILTTFQ